jgi:hypothetical protein
LTGNKLRATDHGQLTTHQIKKASPWLGSFLFCFKDPSWSQDPKRFEVIDQATGLKATCRAIRRRYFFDLVVFFAGAFFATFLAGAFFAMALLPPFSIYKFNARSKNGQ